MRRQAGRRGGGVRKPPEKLEAAYQKFENDQDFDAFRKAVGLDAQRATTEVNSP